MFPTREEASFFITFQRTDFLDKKHTVFGRVIEGFEVLENIERTHTTNQFGQDQPIEGAKKDELTKVTILRKRDHEYVPDKVEVEKPDSTDEDESGPDLNPPGDGN